MKSFKQHINEYAWLNEEYDQMLSEKVTAQWARSSFVIMLSGKVLISNNIYKNVTGDSSTGGLVTGHVWHTTSLESLKSLASIQKSNKSVSARSVGGSTPIWASGLLVKLHGNVLFGRLRDIMSVPDAAGRRWIHPSHIIDAVSQAGGNIDTARSWFVSTHTKFISKGIKQMIARLNNIDGVDAEVAVEVLQRIAMGEVRDTHNHTTDLQRTSGFLKQEFGIDDDIWNLIARETGDIMGQMVRDYIKLSQRVIGKYIHYIKQHIIDVSKSGIRDQKNSELLVNNFSIDAVSINLDFLGKIRGQSPIDPIINRYKQIQSAAKYAEIFMQDTGNYDSLAKLEMKRIFWIRI